MTNEAIAFFASRLQFQTDVSDVHAALFPAEGTTQPVTEEEHATEGRPQPAVATGSPPFVLIDARNKHAWDQGHIPGAIHLPHADIADAELEVGKPFVTYCWGPACNGATRAALALARRGFEVKEMIGGVEYWVREGFTLRTVEGLLTREADPLTAPTCGC